MILLNLYLYQVLSRFIEKHEFQHTSEQMKANFPKIYNRFLFLMILYQFAQI